MCDSNFQGGGWALVRRVKQGSTWHPASDDLRGTAEYGTYGTATSDASFSVQYSSWLTLTSEMLFITGELGVLDLPAFTQTQHEPWLISRRQKQVADDNMGCHLQWWCQLRTRAPTYSQVELLRVALFVCFDLDFMFSSKLLCALLTRLCIHVRRSEPAFQSRAFRVCDAFFFFPYLAWSKCLLLIDPR